MSITFRAVGTLPLLCAMLLTACGGGSGAVGVTTSTPQVSQGIAIGEPAPGTTPLATTEFVQAARSAPCSDFRNRLYVVDNKYVVWDRAGNCPDNGHALTLYGASLDKPLCSVADGIAGPRTSCSDESARSLFDTISKNTDKADLGLGAGHQVEELKFMPANAAYGVTRIIQDNVSGIKEPRKVVIRDAAALEKLWNEHFDGRGRVMAPPKVDFDKEMVVGVFLGDGKGGCHTVSISAARIVNGKGVVEYLDEDLAGPAVSCIAMVTQPMDLAVTTRIDGDIQFVAAARKASVSQIEHSLNSLVTEAKQVVVKDQAALNALYAQHSRDKRLLTVDFSTKMVIAVFGGQKPAGCFDTQVSEVVESNGKLVVTVTETVPGPLVLCTANIVFPAHFVEVDRSDAPVEFLTRTVQL
jgi:hypothetical protein